MDPAYKRTAILLMLTVSLSACALSYRTDINQGTFLTQETVSQVEVGMTREQVRFILGLPIAGSPFRNDRWDYVYTRKSKALGDRQAYLVVWFENNQVTRVEPRIPPQE